MSLLPDGGCMWGRGWRAELGLQKEIPGAHARLPHGTPAGAGTQHSRARLTTLRAASREVEAVIVV